MAQHLKSHGEEMGIRPIEVEYDYTAAVARSRAITKRSTGGVQYLLKKNEIDVYNGRGRLAGEGRVAVEGDPPTTLA